MGRTEKSKPSHFDARLLGEASLLHTSVADVARAREESRWHRMRRLAFLLLVVAAWFWGRIIGGDPISFGMPSWLGQFSDYSPATLLIFLLLLLLFVPMLGAGRSPHIIYRPGEITVSLADVKGMPIVVDEVVKTLNLFLGFDTFRKSMGGTPRRAILFEGPPGTGKTYMAKAMAREAGVPFLFVSSSAFQSMYYGQTNRKIRSYFKALRKAARKEGGAIGFIEEIDAIGSSRSGMGGGRGEGVTGVVNELLIQLQSFDTPTIAHRFNRWLIDQVNRWLSIEKQIHVPPPTPANILIIGATNRASDLDPALLRPGRFDRSVHFDLPSKAGRREIIDYYLDRKSHDEELDDPKVRDALASMTFGYSPVMIEHLFDEGLVWALRRGATSMNRVDIQQAKFTEEIGLKHPVEYNAEERARIAIHEAGHAVVAHLVGKDRKLEVLSIIKRRQALGLLAHTDKEERFTRTRSELLSLLQIAFGGMVAEELEYGEASSGVSSDLQTATLVAAQLYGTFGMAGKLISYEAIEGPVHQNVVAKVLGSREGKDAVEMILQESKAKVVTLLRRNRDKLERLRNALLERDELVGDEIIEALEEDVPVVADLT